MEPTSGTSWGCLCSGWHPTDLGGTRGCSLPPFAFFPPPRACTKLRSATGILSFQGQAFCLINSDNDNSNNNYGNSNNNNNNGNDNNVKKSSQLARLPQLSWGLSPSQAGPLGLIHLLWAGAAARRDLHSREAKSEISGLGQGRDRTSKTTNSSTKHQKMKEKGGKGSKEEGGDFVGFNSKQRLFWLIPLNSVVGMVLLGSPSPAAPGLRFEICWQELSPFLTILVNSEVSWQKLSLFLTSENEIWCQELSLFLTVVMKRFSGRNCHHSSQSCWTMRDFLAGFLTIPHSPGEQWDLLAGIVIIPHNPGEQWGIFLGGIVTIPHSCGEQISWQELSPFLWWTSGISIPAPSHPQTSHSCLCSGWHPTGRWISVSASELRSKRNICSD